MKHLCRRSESQSFSGAIVQSVFDHLNFLVCNACHLALLGHVLPQQAMEVLNRATLPTGEGPGKVARAAQSLINLGVPAKLFAVVVSQRFSVGGFEVGFGNFARTSKREDQETKRAGNVRSGLKTEKPPPTVFMDWWR